MDNKWDSTRKVKKQNATNEIFICVPACYFPTCNESLTFMNATTYAFWGVDALVHMNRIACLVLHLFSKDPWPLRTDICPGWFPIPQLSLCKHLINSGLCDINGFCKLALLFTEVCKGWQYTLFYCSDLPMGQYWIICHDRHCISFAATKFWRFFIMVDL